MKVKGFVACLIVLALSVGGLILGLELTNHDGMPTGVAASWSKEGAWNDIYVYKGPGKLLGRMTWSEEEKVGAATITNTEYSYTKEYINLYQLDSNYKSSTTGLPESAAGNAVAFETLNGKIWVRIMWTDTSTFLLVRIYD